MPTESAVQTKFIKNQRPVALAIGGLVALAVGMGIGRFAYTPILPFMLENAGIDTSDAGFVATANYVGYVLGAVAASVGRLPGSSRSWFLGALFTSAVTTAFMGAVDGVALFSAVRFLSGIASAFVLVFASALVLERLARMGRPSLANVHFAGVGVGIIVSSLLIAGAKNLGLDWQGLWILSGIASLIGLLLCAILVPPIQSPNVTAQANDGIPRSLTLLILSYGFVGFGYIITATFISTIVRMEPTVRWLEVPIWMIVGLGAAFSVAVWMKVSAWISLKAAYVLAAAITAISVALTASADNPVLLVIGSFAFGLCFMAVTAFGFMLAREAAPGAARQAIGIMTVAFGAGQAIGPWFAGVIVEQTGSFTVPTLTAAVALMLSSILGGLWQPREG